MYLLIELNLPLVFIISIIEVKFLYGGYEKKKLLPVTEGCKEGCDVSATTHT